MPPAKGILSQGKTLDEIAALAQLGQRFIDLVHVSGIEASRVVKKRRSPVKRAKKEGGNSLDDMSKLRTVEQATKSAQALVRESAKHNAAKKRATSSKAKPAKRTSRAKAKPIAVAVSSLEE